MAYETDTSEINDDERKHAVYDENDIEEATMFTPKSKIGRCASCKEAMSGYGKVIETTTGKADYALMNGTWVYTALTNDKETMKVFIDVKEKENSNNVVDSSEYVIVSTYNEKTGWTTGKESEGVTEYSATTGVRALKVSFNGESYLISENGDDWTLNGTGGTNYKMTKENGKLEFKANHNHLYGTGTSTTEFAKSVWADSSFEKVAFLGQNLMDKGNHYVSCSECGIANYPVAHRTSDNKEVTGKAVCSCGYTNDVDSDGKTLYSSVYVCDAGSSCANAILTTEQLIDSIKEIGESDTTTEADPDAATSIALGDAALAAQACYLWNIENPTTGYMALKTLAETLNTAVGCTKTDEATQTAKKAVETAAEAYTAAADNSTVGTAYDSMKTLLTTGTAPIDLTTETNRKAIDTLAKAIAADAVKFADSANKSKEKALDGIKREALDSFAIKTGSVINVGYDSYTTSKGGTVSFASDTGWRTAGKVKPVSGGFKISGESFLLFEGK